MSACDARCVFTIIATFLIVFVTVLCMVWWPLPTAGAAAVVIGVGGWWAVNHDHH